MSRDINLDKTFCDTLGQIAPPKKKTIGEKQDAGESHFMPKHIRDYLNARKESPVFGSSFKASELIDGFGAMLDMRNKWMHGVDNSSELEGLEGRMLQLMSAMGSAAVEQLQRSPSGRKGRTEESARNLWARSVFLTCEELHWIAKEQRPLPRIPPSSGKKGIDRLPGSILVEMNGGADRMEFVRTERPLKDLVRKPEKRRLFASDAELPDVKSEAPSFWVSTRTASLTDVSSGAIAGRAIYNAASAMGHPSDLSLLRVLKIKEGLDGIADDSFAIPWWWLAPENETYLCIVRGRFRHGQ